MTRRQRPLATLLLLAALLAPLGVPARAQAQIAFSADLGSNEAGSAFATSLSITTTNAAPAGASIIVMAVAASATLPTSVTCSDGTNTYATDVSVVDARAFTSICSTHRIASQLDAGSTITVTWATHTSQAYRARAFAVTGLASAPLDQTQTNSGSGTSPTTGAAAQTSFANELLVGAITDESNTVTGRPLTPGPNGTSNNCSNTSSTTYTALPGVGSGNSPALFPM